MCYALEPRCLSIIKAPQGIARVCKRYAPGFEICKMYFARWISEMAIFKGSITIAFGFLRYRFFFPFLSQPVQRGASA